MKNKKKLVIVFVISILLLTGGITLFFLLKPDFQIKGFNDKLTINYNSKFKNSPGDVCYGNKFICNKVKIKVEGKVDTNKIGKYKIKYSYIYNGKKYYGTTSKSLAPGGKIRSEWITIPNLNKINTVYCGVHKIRFSDGTTVTIDNVHYYHCTID